MSIEETESSKSVRKRKKAGAGSKKSLDEIFNALETLLADMEKEDSLEKSFDMYKQGISLIKEANDSIDRIEKQVKVLDDEGILS